MCSKDWSKMCLEAWQFSIASFVTRSSLGMNMSLDPVYMEPMRYNKGKEIPRQPDQSQYNRFQKLKQNLKGQKLICSTPNRTWRSDLATTVMLSPFFLKEISPSRAPWWVSHWWNAWSFLSPFFPDFLESTACSAKNATRIKISIEYLNLMVSCSNGFQERTEECL